jgi:hypothetical protein
MMIFKTAIVVISLASDALAWRWGKSGKWDHHGGACRGDDSYIRYTTITGFFQQDDPATDASTFDYVRRP